MFASEWDVSCSHKDIPFENDFKTAVGTGDWRWSLAAPFPAGVAKCYFDVSVEAIVSCCDIYVGVASRAAFERGCEGVGSPEGFWFLGSFLDNVSPQSRLESQGNTLRLFTRSSQRGSAIRVDMDIEAGVATFTLDEEEIGSISDIFAEDLSPAVGLYYPGAKVTLLGAYQRMVRVVTLHSAPVGDGAVRRIDCLGLGGDLLASVEVDDKDAANGEWLRGTLSTRLQMQPDQLRLVEAQGSRVVGDAEKLAGLFGSVA